MSSNRNTHQKRHKQTSGEQTKELVTKEEGQEYATITKVFGGSRFDVACFDSVNRLAHAGTMRKSQWVNNGDLVLVSRRDYEDKKCDIIHVYTAEDARRLKAKGELPDAIDVDKNSDEEDMPFDFALSQLSTARTLIDNLAKDYLRSIKFADTQYRCKELKRAALGRMATISKKLSTSLAYLERVRQNLSCLPSINPNTRIIMVTGFPNVGKSSFMNHISNADVDVQSFAFTN